MVIYSTFFNRVIDTLEIDQNLSFYLKYIENAGLFDCGGNELSLRNGQILITSPDLGTLMHQGLNNGDLVGGLIIGTWQPSFTLLEGFNYYIGGSCYYRNCCIEDDIDVILGFRFKINNQFHYG